MYIVVQLFTLLWILLESLILLCYRYPKATAAIVCDSDCSWFNNPQYRLTVNKPTTIFVSVTPFGSETDASPVVALEIVSSTKHSSNQKHLWDCAVVDVVASEKIYSTGRVKGQEASIWNVVLQPRVAYHIVPHTMRRSIAGELWSIELFCIGLKLLSVADFFLSSNH
jgi:hypothetical protein